MKATPKTTFLEPLYTITTGRNRIQTIRANVCVYGEDATQHSMTFTDFVSLKEYTIAGMCQTCQDKYFRDPEEN